MFEIYDGRLSFYQWDSGEKIRLTETPTGDCQVHFQNTSSDVCLTVTPKEVDGTLLADVPNILLQSPETITVWCYVSDGDEKHTIRREDFEVTPRQKPSDYVYSETEVLSFDSKLNKNFGTENAGKALIVGEDGNVICGTAGGGNNLPITHLKSEDRVNPQELCKIDAGIYILYGYFTPYAHLSVAHAPASATENVIESIKRNGTALAITNKTVNITVPTTVAEMTDAGDYALKSEIPDIPSIEAITNAEIDAIFAT